MNMSFKLGKVVVPVGDVKVELEGLEFSVSDYNLMEGLKVVQAMPKVLREIKAVVEGEDAPSADTKEQESDDDVPGFIKDIIAKAGGHIVDTPFGKHVAIPKEHPLVSALGQPSKPSLSEMLSNIGKLPPQGKNPLEDLLGKLFDKEA